MIKMEEEEKKRQKRGAEAGEGGLVTQCSIITMS